MPQYQVENSRWDTSPTSHKFNAVNDEDAGEYFRKNFRDNSSYAADYLVLSRVVELERSDPETRHKK